MANQPRVQLYLEEHKIGALFEELMGKVIGDMPDEPITYLIRALQRKATRMGLSKETNVVRKSADHDKYSRTVHFEDQYGGSQHPGYSQGRDYEQVLVQTAPPHGYRHTWQAEGMAVPKERTYEKPWQSNAKRPSATHPARRSGGKAEWNADTKVKATSDLDDLWGTKSEGQPKVRGRSPSPARRNVVKTATWEDGDDEFTYTSYGYSGPRKSRASNSLDDELINVRDMSTDDEKFQQSKLPPCKHNDMRAQTERHRHELEKLVLKSERKPAEDSGIEDDRETERDDAIELIENPEELLAEGVGNMSKRGVALKHNLRNVARLTITSQRWRAPDPQQPARISICARCAKVMTGEPSTPVKSRGGYEQEDVFAVKPVSASRYSPVTTRVVESDEEFESVSQVTGPRKPVWQEDSDTEGVTPRKGKHMFATNTVPAKGRPMFSPDPAALSQSQDISKSSSARTYTTTKPQSELRQTWAQPEQAPPTEVSEDAKSAALSTIEEEERALSMATTARHGWQVHDDETEVSSFYGSPGFKGTKQYTGAY